MNMQQEKVVSFVNLKSQADKLEHGIQNAINRVIAHGRFIMGPEVFEFERKLAEYCGAKYAVTCSSGTDALLMALMAINLRPGDVVLTTPFSFIATAEVIALLGAVPVFVDIEPDTYNIDPEKLNKTISVLKGNKKKNVRCIIPVDIFGLPADFEKINEVAKSHGLHVIEDAAQGFGGSLKENKACHLSDIGTTSFFPAKPLGCYGDGGAIFTDDDKIHEKLVSIRIHGKGEGKYDNVRIGINGRLDTIQAAVLLEKLKIFDWELERRNVIAAYYRERLEGKVNCQQLNKGFQSAWAQFSFVSEQREMIMEKLDEKGIPWAVYYPKALHLQKAFSFLGYSKGDFPVSERVSETILSIPVHPYLSIESAEFISNTIISALCKR
ncbi:DegT/DnrJ/EryC1/StrS family aminotransferase [Desulfobacter curvatus]|uniref:DegT/DnrJ/EryC1/StrS family aminotransferase n=1 Tax=Desulfobacter curvatus TaxID=2290 RepID=UPI00037008D3|nr:DegT/DnrJ/EryC1/StrS family aminotransferase [Desulfobacter curvatus]